MANLKYVYAVYAKSGACIGHYKTKSEAIQVAKKHGAGIRTFKISLTKLRKK